MIVLYAVGALAAGLLLYLAVEHNDARFAKLIVVAMYTTRLRVSVAGFDIRLELAVGLVATAMLFGASRHERSIRLSSKAIVCVSLVIGWLAIVGTSSVLNAPQLTKSLSVYLWCVLSLMTAIWLAKRPASWEPLLRFGYSVSLCVSVLAVFFWALAGAGGPAIGVQVDPAYGGYAAYVLSHEANILGGLVCLWALTAAARPMNIATASSRVLPFVAPLVLVATHTRAALVAYMVGLIFLAVSRDKRATSARRVLLVAVVAVPVFLAQSHAAGLSKFGELTDLASGTGGLRYQVNMAAYHQVVADGRWFGLGFNTFGQRNYDPTRLSEMLPAYLGNLPLQIFYDGGLISLALVIGSVIVMVETVRSVGRIRYVLGIGLPYFLFSIATSALWTLETWLFVGVALGMLGTAPRGGHRDGSDLGTMVAG